VVAFRVNSDPTGGDGNPPATHPARRLAASWAVSIVRGHGAGPSTRAMPIAC